MNTHWQKVQRCKSDGTINNCPKANPQLVGQVYNYCVKQTQNHPVQNRRSVIVTANDGSQSTVGNDLQATIGLQECKTHGGVSCPAHQIAKGANIILYALFRPSACCPGACFPGSPLGAQSWALNYSCTFGQLTMVAA